jgi:hypothetical protein
MKDTEFDSICRLALENWQDIKHSLKYKIVKEDLYCGSLYHLGLYDYPEGLKKCALQWAKSGNLEY